MDKCRHVEETFDGVDFESPFMSENQLRNIRCSRRDDMLLWLIMLVYYYKGSLPWLTWDNNTIQINKTMMR